MEQGISMEELEAFKHDDLRKFASDSGIEIPDEIKTKKALVPFLFDVLQADEASDPEEPEQTGETGSTEIEEESDHEATEQSQEIENAPDTENEAEPDPESETSDPDRYITEPQATGTIVYDRKTHTAKMIPR